MRAGCASWSSRTSRSWRGCSSAASARRGTPADVAPSGRGGALDGAGRAVRRDRPRRDAARASTASRPAASCARGASGRRCCMLTARDAVEDRIVGARHRRRRLPGQAVRVRASCWRGCGRSPARARRSGRSSSQVGDLRLDPATHRAWRGETRARAVREGVRAARGVHAAARRGALARRSSSTRAWDIAFESRSNVVDVYVRYLREKIDRPFEPRARSRRCAASATGCARLRG